MSQVPCKPYKILTLGDIETDQDYYDPGKIYSKCISKLNKTKTRKKSFTFQARFMRYIPKVCIITMKVTQTAKKSRKLVCFPETYAILCFPVTRDP